jgi:acyl dehydratase
VPGQTFPEYRVTARNTSAASENAIHHDDVARRYGFPGALVPGVTIYAYLTRPLAAAFGTAWLQRGTASVRFSRPVLDGQEIVVASAITERDAAITRIVVTASTASAGECARLDATVPAGLPTPVNLALYAAVPLPAERPPARREHLDALRALGTPEVLYDATRAADYVEAVSDDLPLYRGAGAVVHPAFYLHLANRALDRNVRLGPWIHVGSVVRHLATAAVGETLAVRGRVRSLYERKEREYVELDLVILAGRRPLAHVLHTAIYRLPEPT